MIWAANPIVFLTIVTALNHLIVPAPHTSGSGSSVDQQQQRLVAPSARPSGGDQQILESTIAATTEYGTANNNNNNNNSARMSNLIQHVDAETTLDEIRSLLRGGSGSTGSGSSGSKVSPTVLIAVASFAPRCQSLLSELKTALETEYGTSSTSCCSGGDRPKVLLIQTDASDEMEEIAIELGLRDVPSFQIYGLGGELIGGSKAGGDVTVSSIMGAIRSACAVIGGNDANGSSGGGGCCPPGATPAVCCPGGSSSSEPNSVPTDPTDVLRMVQRSYAATVNRSSGDGSNGGGCCVSVDPKLVGYTPSQIIQAGNDSNLGLGCGNPMSFANIVEGETVLDLGSGAGVDCFLAAEVVGPTGKVIGVDMTPDMIYRARMNAAKRVGNSGDTDAASASTAATNVEFRLGEIEHLPVADGTVDCVVSNCVINLSPDKAQVFREIHRILRVGGRVAISDVVVRPEKIIPDRLRTAEALAC